MGDADIYSAVQRCGRVKRVLASFQVQAMVQEMKVGFMAALDQLSTMQDGDQTSWHEVDATCKRQDQQLSDFAQSMESLQVRTG